MVQNHINTALVVALSILFVLATGMGLFGCADPRASYGLIEQNTLTVVTSADFPPMEYIENDEFVGFDPELAKEIGNRLGLEVQFKNQDFDTLIDAVANEKMADVAIAAISINDERLQLVDFSDPYYSTNQDILVRTSSNFTSRDDINREGINVTAQSGSTGEAWAEQNLPNATLKVYKSTNEMIEALHSGTVEAVIFDDSVARAHIEMDTADCTILETVGSGEQYGIAVVKDNPALLDAINVAIADMKNDHTIDEFAEDFIS